jgi:hypothetical protein
VIEREHPTHKRVTIAVFLALWIGCAASLLYMFLIAGSIDERRRGLWAFLSFFVCGMLWILCRVFTLRCATCGAWLRRADDDGLKRTRRYYCTRCDTLWDSGTIGNASWDGD